MALKKMLYIVSVRIGVFSLWKKSIYVTFHAKRGLMDFIVNREINISRRVHYCSNSFHYAQ